MQKKKIQSVKFVVFLLMLDNVIELNCNKESVVLNFIHQRLQYLDVKWQKINDHMARVSP